MSSKINEMFSCHFCVSVKMKLSSASHEPFTGAASQQKNKTKNLLKKYITV